MGAYHIKEFAHKVQAAAPTGYFITVNYQKDEQPSREFGLFRKRDDKQVASIKAQTLPGCCGVLVIHGLVGFQGHSGVVPLVQAITAGAKKTKYGQAILTLLRDSVLIPELQHVGWHVAQTFVNGKTDNQVSTLIRELEQTPREVRRDETRGE